MPERKRLRRAQSSPLAELSPFTGLSDDQLRILDDASRTLKLSAHRLAFKGGTPARDIFVLVSGSLKRVVPLPAGGEKVVELVQPGQVFGLGESLGDGRFSSHAETLTDSVVIAVSTKVFRTLLEENRELMARTVRSLAQRLCAVEFETASHHAQTGTRRLLDYLIAQAGGRLPLAGETMVMLDSSKKLLASRIAMTPETFSRTLRQLVDSGAIVVDGRRVHIQNAILALKGRDAEPKALKGLKRKKPVARGAERGISSGGLINLCGRQRMLSQRLATAWAMVRQSIAPARARMTLRQLLAQFDRNLVQLGRAPLSGAVAKTLDHLNELWPVYRDALNGVADSDQSPDRVLELSELMLDAADRMTNGVEKAFGTPEGHRVNLAGRNRMISQRMAKLYMFRVWNVKRPEVARWLDASRTEFAANLDELRSSEDSDPALAEQLKTAAVSWKEFDELVCGGRHQDATVAKSRAVLAASERLLRHVDTTVKLYEYLTG